MAPKKDPKKAGPAKRKGKGVPSSASPPDPQKAGAATPDELQKQLEAILLEKAKEEKERNYLQLERDKIASFLDIKKREAEQAKVELRLRDRHLEEIEERHQDEIKVYNQKMKHLLYEQQKLIAAARMEHEVAMKLQREELVKRETELMNDRRNLKERIKELELAYEDTIKQVKLDHAKELSKMKQEYDASAKELHLKAEKKIKTIRDDCELQRKQEIHEIEERKNSHINELMKKHEKAFTEIKCYYNDITHNNLDLIKTLKEDVTDMKKKEAANEKLMYEIAQENKKLTEPLTRALKQVENQRKQLTNYEKDKLSLHQSRIAHADALKQLKNLEFEYGKLQQQFDEIKKERDQLLTKFGNKIFEVKQKADMEKLVLQKKVQVLGENVERKDAQLADCLASTNNDPLLAQQAKENIEKVLEIKNTEISQLRYDLGKMTKAYKDTVQAFGTKLAEYGIPLEEMGLLYYMSFR